MSEGTLYEGEWDDDEEERSEDERLLDECGLGDDGQCTLAGTEHCDFECPLRDSDQFAGSIAWEKKHGLKQETNDDPK